MGREELPKLKLGVGTTDSITLKFCSGTQLDKRASDLWVQGEVKGVRGGVGGSWCCLATREPLLCGQPLSNIGQIQSS